MHNRHVFQAFAQLYVENFGVFFGAAQVVL
jgi:hypothetical protein